MNELTPFGDRELRPCLEEIAAQHVLCNNGLRAKRCDLLTRVVEPLLSRFDALTKGLRPDRRDEICLEVEHEFMLGRVDFSLSFLDLLGCVYGPREKTMLVPQRREDLLLDVGIQVTRSD